MTLVTYLGDAKLKADFVAEIAKHEAADQIIAGTYKEWDGQVFRACAIGCSLHSLNILQGKSELCEGTALHERFEIELGWPIWLAYLEDDVFEHLPANLQKTWPRRIAEAIPVGAVADDIALAKILRWLLTGEEFGVRHASNDPEIVGVVDRMGALFDRVITNDNVPTENEWHDVGLTALAARAAWAALAAEAALAARAALAAEAARAVWAARAAEAVRAARAAWAAWAARDAAKRDAYYPALSEVVLTLLRELPVLV